MNFPLILILNWHYYYTLIRKCLTPKGLPPQREQDRAILLQQGSRPDEVKPYKYPHIQEEQIKKIIKEMLGKGNIQPSNSHFSSLILLVKKDGRWRLCTNYRASNAITMKNMFPMPIIDELHIAKFFQVGSHIMISSYISTPRGYSKNSIQKPELTKEIMNGLLCHLVLQIHLPPFNA